MQNNKKFPSDRFDDFRSTLIVHVLCGAFVVYSGCFLFIRDVFSPWTKEQDEKLSWKLFYYIYAVATTIHCVTTLRVSSKVMGEKRITLPFAALASSLNLFNAVYLVYRPTLGGAFLVWGSMNTFVFARVNLIILAVAKIDWELIFTYSIVSAPSVVYPMTNQPSFIYYLVMILPILYAPFHERVCYFYGWETEDTLKGNKPAEKNISNVRRGLRKMLTLSVIPSTSKDGSVKSEKIVSFSPKEVEGEGDKEEGNNVSLSDRHAFKQKRNFFPFMQKNKASSLSAKSPPTNNYGSMKSKKTVDFLLEEVEENDEEEGIESFLPSGGRSSLPGQSTVSPNESVSIRSSLRQSSIFAKERAYSIIERL